MKKIIRSQYLLKIKRIIDLDENGDKFTLAPRNKNKIFLREYGLKFNDIKNIIRNLSVEDCFEGPELDRDSEYNGLIFKFCPIFEKIKLYIKIRIENDEKTVCISLHEYGLYSEES